MKPADRPRFARGLVVGKFSPLHKGHEFLIEQARSECEELYLISYSEPEFPSCDRLRREAWLKQRFPQLPALVLDPPELCRLAATRGIHAPPHIPPNDAPDTDHRQFCGWLCQNLLGTQIDVVFSSENYGEGFASELTHYFRHFSPDTPDVVHRCIDRNRVQVPISGSLLRTDLHGLRQFLAPEVYGDFVERILLLGGESTGKTVLAEALSRSLETEWAAEYGREYWVQRRGELTFADMLHIAQSQVAREKALTRKSRRWLVCDTSPLTTLFYSHVLFGRADPLLEQLTTRQYHRVFLCADDFNFIQDGTRRDAAFRKHQQDWYMNELARREIAYEIVAGSVDRRVRSIMRAISIRPQSKHAQLM